MTPQGATAHGREPLPERSVRSGMSQASALQPRPDVLRNRESPIDEQPVFNCVPGLRFGLTVHESRLLWKVSLLFLSNVF